MGHEEGAGATSERETVGRSGASAVVSGYPTLRLSPGRTPLTSAGTDPSVGSPPVGFEDAKTEGSTSSLRPRRRGQSVPLSHFPCHPRHRYDVCSLCDVKRVTTHTPGFPSRDKMSSWVFKVMGRRTRLFGWWGSSSVETSMVKEEGQHRWTGFEPPGRWDGFDQ